MTTLSPTWPASFTGAPLPSIVKLVLLCGWSSMLPGCPFLNSMVRRSYPAWVPVRTASTNADNGGVGWFVTHAAPQRYDEVGLGEGDGAGLGSGEGAGETPGVGLPCPPD